jgi:hypothetical protein
MEEVELIYSCVRAYQPFVLIHAFTDYREVFCVTIRLPLSNFGSELIFVTLYIFNVIE